MGHAEPASRATGFERSGRSEIPSRLALVSLAVLTAASLAQQVAITRSFSSVLAYHFSFLAVSIAMLGTGSGALFVFLRPDGPERSIHDPLSRWALVFAVSLIALPLGLSCGLLILYAAVLEPIVRASISLSLGLRIALAFALLAPLGACLGCAMPLGLSRLSDRGSGAVAYAWGVNGFASVVASVAGIFIAIHFGLSRAMLAGAACYAIALGWAQLTSTRPPDGSPDERRS